MSSVKIMELENGINQVLKMKDIENDCYQMEKTKIQNSADFAVE